MAGSAMALPFMFEHSHRRGCLKFLENRATVKAKKPSKDGENNKTGQRPHYQPPESTIPCLFFNYCKVERGMFVQNVHNAPTAEHLNIHNQFLYLV
jgi:hypothetical protein